MSVSGGDSTGARLFRNGATGLLTGFGGPRRMTRARPRRAVLSITLHRHFGEVEDIWRAFERDAHASGFQSFDWLSAWHANVGEAEGVSPAILLVSLGNAPLMLLPFGVERRFGARCLVWLGGKFADYKGPLLAPDFAARFPAQRLRHFWPSLARALPPHDLVLLENQPARLGGLSNPFAALSAMLAPDAAYAITLPAEWETFSLRFRAETRRNDRVKERKLAALGKLEFRIAENPAEARAMTREILTRKAIQLRAQGIASIFEEPGYASAFDHLASLDGDRRILQAAMLTLDGDFLSGSIAQIWRNSSTLLVHTYSGKYAKLSPGRLHLLRLVRASIEAGHGSYDLSIGHAPYKDSFCDEEMQLFNHVAAVTPWGMPAAASARTFLALKRGVKNNDQLMNAFLSVREWVKGK